MYLVFIKKFQVMAEDDWALFRLVFEVYGYDNAEFAPALMCVYVRMFICGSMCT